MMKARIVLLLIAANVALGAAPTTTATQSKPNVFGETRTVVQSSASKPTTIVTQKKDRGAKAKLCR
jgi:hypothetical protein